MLNLNPSHDETMDALAHLGTLFEEEADSLRCQQEENSPQTPSSWNTLSQENPFLSNASLGSQNTLKKNAFRPYINRIMT